MRPKDGDDVSSDSDSGSGSGGEGGEEEEWSVEEGGAVLRAVAALDALRVARQHYDLVLTAADGSEVPAHRALMAAASPYLLRALPAVGGAGGPGGGPLVCHVPSVGGAALAQLVQWAYSGRLTGSGAKGARQLYLAAWRLRFEAARALLADRLMRRLTPLTAIQTRALPDLPQTHQDALDAYITEHFDEICSMGALSCVPLLRVELVAASSSAGGGEAARAVADAALAWLRTRHPDEPLDSLCARDHLVYVDGGGALRDCDELPADQCGDRLVREYRAARAEREEAAPEGEPEATDEGEEATPVTLGGRAWRGEWRVVAARGAAGVTRALLLLGGRLAGARVAWRDTGGSVARGGPLGGAREAAQGGERRAPLPGGRAAMGAAALGGRLLVCGGYDRAAVLAHAAAYLPSANRWLPLPPLRSPRARFPVATLGSKLYVIGGSDGHNELDSVDVYEEEEAGRGRWAAGPRLPRPVSLAGAAADSAGGLWLVGGWAGGRPLRDTLRYTPAEGWRAGPPLGTARWQLCAVLWEGALWAVGGCDAWHCLAGTERLDLDHAGAGDAGEPTGTWEAAAPLPVPRRSVGGAAWRGALWAAGGSDGACSLAQCCRLPTPGAAAWAPAPSLRCARAAPALLSLDDALYAVGGFDGKEFLSSVECLYDPEGEWTSLVVPPPSAGPGHTEPHSRTPAEEQPEDAQAPAPAVNVNVNVNGAGAHRA